jgi:hypothetical protein
MLFLNFFKYKKLIFFILSWTISSGREVDIWSIWSMVDAAITIGPQYDIEPELLIAVSFVETRWNYNVPCRNRHSACGLYQQIPKYSGMWVDECWDDKNQLICRQPGLQPYAAAELLDIYRATRVASRHLSYLRNRYENQALSRYNRGRRYNDEIGLRYHQKVTRIYNLLSN